MENRYNKIIEIAGEKANQDTQEIGKRANVFQFDESATYEKFKKIHIQLLDSLQKYDGALEDYSKIVEAARVLSKFNTRELSKRANVFQFDESATYEKYYYSHLSNLIRIYRIINLKSIEYYTEIVEESSKFANQDTQEIGKRANVFQFDEAQIYASKQAEHLTYLLKSLIEELEKSNRNKIKNLNINKQLCFVLMPFKKGFNELYYDVIKPTVSSLGFDCKRADENFSANVIIHEIQDDIKNAKFLIADITGKNPNVFYEIGFAHALPRNVILITQDDENPFDIQHIRYIKYETINLEKFKENLIKTIQGLKFDN